MPIKDLTPSGQIEQYVRARAERLVQAVIYNLSVIGEKVLNKARSTDSYKDQTGNLRSSIGYVIAVDGSIVKISSFALSEKGSDRVTGQTAGKAFAEELVRRFPTGIVLIVVAGMNYASCVSAKGYDVLDSSELLAEELVPKMLKQLGITA